LICFEKLGRRPSISYISVAIRGQTRNKGSTEVYAIRLLLVYCLRICAKGKIAKKIKMLKLMASFNVAITRTNF